MTAQQLKASILQLAILGKLVPQNSEDEPASVLLKKIKTEKDALVKAGKLKKDKHESVIIRSEDGRYLEKKDGKITDITDEIPFEIPESWEWVRLKTVTSVLEDGIHGTPIFDPNGEVFFINGNNLCNGEIIIKNDTKRVSKEESLKHLRPLQEQTILVSINGTLGNVAFYQNEPVILGKSACYFNLLGNIYKDYIKMLLQTSFFLKYATNKATGSTINNVSLAAMRDFLFPLPPLNEQARIVAKIEELLPHIEEYGKAETELSKLKAELPEQLKKSILQWAIQGRLVPQDPTDEPASELLKRIKAEKNALIKSGKLKKEKPLPPISEDEIPFDIPDSWEWVRLGSIITLISGQDFPPSGYNDRQDGIPYITGASNMDNGKLIVNRWTPSPSSIALQGDLLITCKGAGVGKMALMDIPKAHVARQIMAIRPVDGVNASFVKAFIQSNLPTVRRQMNGLIPGISREVMLQLLFPLPPFAEQKRITKKLETILSIIHHFRFK